MSEVKAYRYISAKWHTIQPLTPCIRNIAKYKGEVLAQGFVCAIGGSANMTFTPYQSEFTNDPVPLATEEYFQDFYKRSVKLLGSLKKTREKLVADIGSVIIITNRYGKDKNAKLLAISDVYVNNSVHGNLSNYGHGSSDYTFFELWLKWV
jgi:hypothetical protein